MARRRLCQKHDHPLILIWRLKVQLEMCSSLQPHSPGYADVRHFLTCLTAAPNSDPNSALLAVLLVVVSPNFCLPANRSANWPDSICLIG